MLTEDLGNVLESANIPAEEIKELVSSIHEIAKTGGITQEQVQQIVDDLHAILDEFQGSLPVDPPADPPTAPPTDEPVARIAEVIDMLRETLDESHIVFDLLLGVQDTLEDIFGDLVS